MRVISVFRCLLLLAVSMPSAFAQEPAKLLNWKVLLVAGDDSIPVFDNAVRTLAVRLQRRGADVRVLSSSPPLARRLGLATVENVNATLASLKIGPGDACLLYFTSHGTEAGLLFARDAANNQKFYPEDLIRLLDSYCGAQPAVAIMSGCHSGTFLRDGVRKENHVVLTAARLDRSSFGCDFRLRYTYFDGCFLDEFDRSRSWRDVFARTVECIEEIEAGFTPEPSEPQAFFGAATESLPLPGQY